MKKISYISIAIGLIYYLVAPIILINFDCINNFPFIEIYKNLISSLNNEVYIIYILLFLFIFYIIFSYPIHDICRYNNIYTQYNKLPKVFFIFFLGLQLWSYYNLRDILFMGYLGAENIEINEFKSIICGINIVYSFFYVYYKASSYKKYVNYFLLQLIINSIVLLGSGSRIYVLTTILILFYANFFYESGKFIRYKILKITTIAFMVIMGIVYVGIIRQNLSPDIDSLCYYLFSEPYNIWLSGANLITSDELSFVNFPYDLIISSIGILPTIIFPFKFELMGFLDNLINVNRVDLYSPLGGTSIVYTLVTNFGLYGILFSFILISLLIRKIYIKSINNNFYAAYYVVFCSLIPFIFFREGFFHILKNTIFNAFLVPYIFLNLRRALISIKNF